MIVLENGETPAQLGRSSALNRGFPTRPSDRHLQKYRKLIPQICCAQASSLFHQETMSGNLGRLRAVQSQGWDPNKDVRIVTQAPEIGGSALKSGQIDAHADFVPFGELLPFRRFARGSLWTPKVAAPKGLQDSAQGFNPGNRHPERRALKGRQIERTNNVKASSNCVPRLNCAFTFSQKSVRDISGRPLAPSGRTRLF